MDRHLRKHNTIYQGLFLMALGLFAYERMQTKEVPVLKSPEAESVTSPVAGARTLELLLKELKAESVFLHPIDGLRLRQSGNRISIVLQNDELYRGDGVAIEETWFPILDQIAEALFPKLSDLFQVRIQGFKEGAGDESGVSAFKQESAYTLATSRAEWLIHYYETKFQTRKNLRFWVGAGLANTGDRIEITIELK